MWFNPPAGSEKKTRTFFLPPGYAKAIENNRVNLSSVVVTGVNRWYPLLLSSLPPAFSRWTASGKIAGVRGVPAHNGWTRTSVYLDWETDTRIATILRIHKGFDLGRFVCQLLHEANPRAFPGIMA